MNIFLNQNAQISFSRFAENFEITKKIREKEIKIDHQI